MELLTAVQLLAGYPYLSTYPITYKSAVLAHFAAHREHRAALLFRALSRDAGWADAYPGAALYLERPPALQERFPAPHRISRFFGGRPYLLEFFKALRAFAEESDFERFFEDHRPFYEHVQRQVHALLEGADPVAEIEAYYGAGHPAYHLVLAPLLHHGGYSPPVLRPDGQREVFVLVGPSGARRGTPIFGPADELRKILWHELGHAFANDLSERHAPELERYADSFPPLGERMQALGYPTWADCVNEHVIRAAVVRLAHRYLGMEAGRQALREEMGRGFLYVEALCQRLETYEAQRDLYPRLGDFYPHLLAAFALQRP